MRSTQARVALAAAVAVALLILVLAILGLARVQTAAARSPRASARSETSAQHGSRHGYLPPPKILWLHWHSARLPPLLEENVKRTRAALSDWDIRLLSTADFVQTCRAQAPDALPPRFFALDATAQSDFMRLWLLQEYGGLWMDVSIVLNTSVTPLYDKCVRERLELVAFAGAHNQRHATVPAIENYFLLAPPRSRLIALWLDEYTTAITEGFAPYIARLRRAGVELQGQGRVAGTYFVHFHALQNVLQTRLGARVPAGVHLELADETMDSIPLRCKWNSACMRRELSDDAIAALPYLKLSKRVRDVFPAAYFQRRPLRV